MSPSQYSFYEFFAGGGMARAGLGKGWECLFANDFDPNKATVYAENWDADDLVIDDVGRLSCDDLPDVADLAWASFPCQDLSLAGKSNGLGHVHGETRSAAFWGFWNLIEGLIAEGRAPRVIVLENVYGCLTSNAGRDFATIGRCLSLAGYRFGAMVIDAALFVPQSRPRLFIMAFRNDIALPPHLLSDVPVSPWHPLAMQAAIDRLAEIDREKWVWICPPMPEGEVERLEALIDDEPEGVVWHSSEQTARLTAMMSPANAAKLDAMRLCSERSVGTIYKRTRPDGHGGKVQRAELRNDGVAGCLRTPGGGSSRQFVVVAQKGKIRTRLMSAREAARLMGLPDSYWLPPRYNDAYHVAGDGLAVPVVQHIARQIVEPVLDWNEAGAFAEAAE